MSLGLRLRSAFGLTLALRLGLAQNLHIYLWLTLDLLLRVAWTEFILCSDSGYCFVTDFSFAAATKLLQQVRPQPCRNPYLVTVSQAWIPHSCKMLPNQGVPLPSRADACSNQFDQKSWKRSEDFSQPGSAQVFLSGACSHMLTQSQECIIQLNECFLSRICMHPRYLQGA